MPLPQLLLHSLREMPLRLWGRPGPPLNPPRSKRTVLKLQTLSLLLYCRVRLPILLKGACTSHSRYCRCMGLKSQDSPMQRKLSRVPCHMGGVQVMRGQCGQKGSLLPRRF